MRSSIQFEAIVVILCLNIKFSTAIKESTLSPSSQIESGNEYDSESARKIIGSRVVTSVSVVMKGKEPQFSDAVGNYIPRPLVPPRVASPVSLLDPDRYEFYTFNDNGELVKRLMTMEEIQSIVANGDSEQPAALPKNPSATVDNEANIRDIVNNVQKVLHSEMVNNNFTASLLYNKLDTPDTSSSWSSILPAIFGNTGESILTNKMPVTTGSTADSIILHSTSTSKKPIKNKISSTLSVLKTTLPPKTTVNKLTKQKPKPSRPVSVLTPNFTTLKPHNVTPHIKHTVAQQTTQNLKNKLTTFQKTPYLQKNTTLVPQSTKTVSTGKPIGSSKPSTAFLQKVSTQLPTRTVSFTTINTSTKKPVNKRPTSSNKYSTSDLTAGTAPTKIPTLLESITVERNSTGSILPVSLSHSSQLIPTSTKRKPSTSITTPKPKTTKITTNTDALELKENVAITTDRFMTTSANPITTRKTVTNAIQMTTLGPHQTINPESVAGFEPEPDNIFDSELSLNQIIESLKDLEGTTMPFASNYMDFIDMTTIESETDSLYEKFTTEPVTITNNGPVMNLFEKDQSEFKQSIVKNVSYIPQTTIDFSQFTPTTESYSKMKNYTSINLFNTSNFNDIEHKESADDMILDEKSTTESDITTTIDINSTKHSNMDSLLRESFDSVLSQIQNEGLSTTIDYRDMITSPDVNSQDSTTMKMNEKKMVVKPTPFIGGEELGGGATEPMKYFEAVIQQYELEKNKSESTERTTTDLVTQAFISEILNKTTEKSAEVESKTEAETRMDEVLSEYFTTGKQVGQRQTTILPNEEISQNVSKTENLIQTETEESTTIVTTISPEETSTIQQYVKDMTEKQAMALLTSTENIGNDRTTVLNGDPTTATVPYESTYSTVDIEMTDQTMHANKYSELNMDSEKNQPHYEMIQLIENIVKNISNIQNSTSSIQRKEDSTEPIITSTAFESQNITTNRDETEFSDLGETTTMLSPQKKNQNETIKNKFNNKTSIKSAVNKLKLPTLAPAINDLKMKVVNALKNTVTINLEPAPKQALGLEESTANAGEDILEFTKFCNEVAFNFWIALNNEGISSARSLTLSPFALTSMIAMLFLGARGKTSGEINDMLHLDDIVTFNPHAMLRNISESVDEKKDNNVYNSVFVRELLSERSKGKILPFFKEKVNQFYFGYVEEVNFSTVNDIIRRRTNLLMKRYTAGKSSEYLKTSNVWVKPPLAGISANLYETDCSKASRNERDGEMFFQVIPAVRQRRLIPIPSAVFKSGFTAGYDPELDATAVAIGLSNNILSNIYVMPGQQGHSVPGDNLERLESVLMANAISQNAWRRLLATLMERPGLEVQIPRFTHRSFVNTTNALRKLGLHSLFDQNVADLRGITGAASDMYVSDLIQMNTFSTCGEDKLAEDHHVEMYPAPPNKHRTIEHRTSTSTSTTSASATNKHISTDYDNERAFASDPIYDLRYLDLPLPLRPRQARIPEAPRLRFDKPFIYFVRHNPTGMILHFGRFNPRLLP